MRLLNQLLGDVRVLNDIELNPEIAGLEYDSRKVSAGDCFFAVVGTASDGHDYIASAIERGAKAVVCQRMPEVTNDDVAYILVDDSNIAMAAMAAAFYDHPSRQLKLVGVTGTNGKTTTATLLYDMFMAMGYPSGLISTVV
ncbi:MAG: UDP-N-acetylmuramoyl-L-alanyl-D-glutamate--2,6-diaminopimelate ligase, partial [Alistipes sp.]|nr:UDP-N-acetylmuramoyl-L-alanyl-D-glutamate--2,6-diaminopimelate ligase [Alistipes sp.]